MDVWLCNIFQFSKSMDRLHYRQVSFAVHYRTFPHLISENSWSPRSSMGLG